MSKYAVSLADVRALGQVAVLVMPVLALSYLVTDTDKYKVSSLLKSPIVTRVTKVKNPEMYDAILPLIFSALAVVGFSIGLYLIVAKPYIYLLDLVLIALGACGLIIIFQIVLSIVVPALEKLLEHHDKAIAKRALFAIPNLTFLALAAITLVVILVAIGGLVNLTFESFQLTIQ
jgi:hypothetical protein